MATAFITRCSVAAISLAVAACHGDAQGSTIRSAQRDGDGLALDLALRFTATELTALDHGIPLRLAVRIDAEPPLDTAITLRYRPLSRQYELRLSGDADARVFASRERLLAALERVVVGDVAATRGQVRVALDRAALPAPLRLPALIDRDWQLATPAVAWGD